MTHGGRVLEYMQGPPGGQGAQGPQLCPQQPYQGCPHPLPYGAARRAGLGA